MTAGSEPGRLEIRVLGPVEVAWDGRPIDIGGVKARALIARLLIDRQIIVSVDRLVDSLWGDHDGPGAEIALRSTDLAPAQAPARRRGARGPHCDEGPGLRPGGPRGGDRRRPARTSGGGGAEAAGPTAPERVHPAARRSGRALARNGLQRGPRRAVRPGGGTPTRGTAALGERDEDRRGADARPARGHDRRVGVA